VTRSLEDVIEHRGKPETIRCDNGPELTSRHFLSWCEERKIQLIHIQPGRPMQNGHVESFNGRLRDECLNAKSLAAPLLHLAHRFEWHRMAVFGLFATYATCASRHDAGAPLGPRKPSSRFIGCRLKPSMSSARAQYGELDSR
jgi:Integrase core domain